MPRRPRPSILPPAPVLPNHSPATHSPSTARARQWSFVVVVVGHAVGRGRTLMQHNKVCKGERPASRLHSVSRMRAQRPLTERRTSPPYPLCHSVTLSCSPPDRYVEEGARVKSAIRNTTNDTWPLRPGRRTYVAAVEGGRSHPPIFASNRTPYLAVHKAPLTSHFGKEDGVVNAARRARDIATGGGGGGEEGACRSPKSPFGRGARGRFLTTAVARIPI